MAKKSFIRQSGHCYLVKNQNGFNNALYDYFYLDDCTYTKKEIRSMVQTFPTSYPCTIVIINQVFECKRLYIETINISWWRKIWLIWQ